MLMGLKSALVGAMTADCFSIGVDGENDIVKIYKSYYHFNQGIVPIKNSRYYGFEKSQPSIYGVQILVTMEYLQVKEVLPQKEFKSFWLTKMNDYTLYYDFYKKLIRKLNYQGASEGFDEGHLGYVSMLLPYMIKNKRLSRKEKNEVVDHIHCLDQNKHLREIVNLFYEMTLLSSDGVPPAVCLKFIRHNHSYFIKTLINTCFDHLDKKPQQLLGIKTHMGSIENNLFYTLFIIMKYENDYKEAIIQNNLLGGDVSTRASLIGMVLGSYLGIERIPQRWIDNCQYSESVFKWLKNY